MAASSEQEGRSKECDRENPTGGVRLYDEKCQGEADERGNDLAGKP